MTSTDSEGVSAAAEEDPTTSEPVVTPAPAPPAAATPTPTTTAPAAPQNTEPQGNLTHAESTPITPAPTPENHGNPSPVNGSGTADVLDRARSSTPQTGQHTATRQMSTLDANDSAAVSQQQTFMTTTRQKAALNSTAQATALAAPNTAATPMALPATINKVATSLVATLFAPFLAPPSTPLTPAEPPLLWAVLASVRREISRTFFNKSPNAVADPVTTSEETPKVIDVLANDTDDDTLSVTSFTQPTNGTVTRNADGTLTYTPKANFTGTDTFTYTVSDAQSPMHLHGLFGFFGSGHTDTASVSVAVTPVNDAPVADNDSYTIGEDGVLNVPAATGVLNGDTDVDNTAAQLHAVLGTGPGHGTLALNENGSFTYTPAANYNGPDSFTYRTSDGTSNSAPATVNITVTPVNDAPVANDDTATTVEDTPVTINVLANDNDAENSPLTTVLASQPTNGTVILNPNKTYTYTPNGGFSGTDSFTYKANDGTLDSTAATVTITVAPMTPSNSAPVAGDPPVRSTIDQTTAAITGQVLATDPDGDRMVYGKLDTPDQVFYSVDVDPDTGAFVSPQRSRPATGQPSTPTRARSPSPSPSPTARPPPTSRYPQPCWRFIRWPMACSTSPTFRTSPNTATWR